MNAIQIVLSVCSILHGAQCRDVELTFIDVPMLVCLTSGQPVVAKWADEHPNWRVHKWSCRVPGAFAKA